MARSRGIIWLSLAIVALGLGLACALAVHRYFERPMVYSALLMEGGTFTVHLIMWGIVQTAEDDMGPPKPGEDPMLTRFCEGAKRTALAKKCDGSKNFNIWARNGPWYPTGWPFISQDHGFLIWLEEADCKVQACPKHQEIIVDELGESRFRLAGFVGNWIVYALIGFSLLANLRVAWQVILTRRARRRAAFPVIELPDKI